MITAREDFLAKVVAADGLVSTDRLSAELRITKIELAHAAGLSRDAVSNTARRPGIDII